MIDVNVEGLGASLEGIRYEMLRRADEGARELANTAAKNGNYEISIVQQEQSMLIQKHDDSTMSIYDPDQALLTESETLLTNLADVFYFEVKNGEGEATYNVVMHSPENMTITDKVRAVLDVIKENFSKRNAYSLQG